MTPRYNATISRRRELHPGLCFLWIHPDSGEVPAFEPGQYISVGRIVETDGAAELIQRTYSIGSSAAKRDEVELFIVQVDDGEFTSWLLDQPVGAPVWLADRAAGGFTLDGFERGKDLVLVATGTGIAPYLSMYRTYRDDPPWRRLVIINGVRYARDLGYRRELEALSDADPRVTYIPLVTREPNGEWSGMRGRVHTVLEPDAYARAAGAPLDPGQCHIYLCGNPGMVDSMEDMLTERGFRKHTPGHPGNLHLEKYW